jgi:1,4-dihydroxy-2-naphthoate octaprenyltransferase
MQASLVAERPVPFAVWLQACRVKSLAISTIGVFAGAAVAVHDGYWSWRILIAWLGSILIQAGTNLTNVSYNYKGGGAGPGIQADTKSSTAVVHAGLLTPAQVRRGGLICFGYGIACGLMLTWLCGPAILWLGLPAVLAGYSYAGPPLRLGYLGLGVVTVFLFMGPVMVGGAYYVMALQFAPSAFAVSIPIGLLAAGIMHVNDVRDYHADVAHGKRTLSTITGRRGASHTLAIIDAAAYVSVAIAVAAGWLPWPVLLVILTIPRAIGQVKLAYRDDSRDTLHEAWLRGVKLHSEFGLLLILGLFAARFL